MYILVTLDNFVTILILVDGFLQLGNMKIYYYGLTCHNPYFSRWFSAISTRVLYVLPLMSHNPYFSRWFSAIKKEGKKTYSLLDVTILILVDGFLQYQVKANTLVINKVTILILVDGFLQ